MHESFVYVNAEKSFFRSYVGLFPIIFNLNFEFQAFPSGVMLDGTKLRRTSILISLFLNYLSSKETRDPPNHEINKNYRGLIDQIV